MPLVRVRILHGKALLAAPSRAQKRKLSQELPRSSRGSRPRMALRPLSMLSDLPSR